MKLHSNGLTYYALQGMNCKIEKYDGTDTSVAIPQILNGYTVKKIDCLAFYKRADLKEVVIPDSVTEINYEAFRGCKALRVWLGSGVKEIKSGALVDVRYIEVSENNPHFFAVDGNDNSFHDSTSLWGI
jgi:hypothetical protein